MKLLEIIKQDRVNLLKKLPKKQLTSLIKDQVGGFFKPKQIYPLHLACAFKAFKCIDYLLTLNVSWDKNLKNKKEYPLDFLLIHLAHGLKTKEDYDHFKKIFESVCRIHDETDFPYSKNLVETLISSVPKKRIQEVLLIANRKLTLPDIFNLSLHFPDVLYNLCNAPESKTLDDYPILKNKFVYEKTLVRFSSKTAEDYNVFFREKSIKQACEKVFGIGSKEFMKNILPLFLKPFKVSPLEKNYKILETIPVKFEFFDFHHASYLQDLKNLFLIGDKPNFNDYLKLAKISGRPMDKEVILFFKEALNHSELISFIPSYLRSRIERERGQSVARSYKHLSSKVRPKFVKFLRSQPLALRKDFKSILKNFEKDLLLMKAPDEKLKAFKIYPNLKKIHGKKIGEYTIKVAQTSHELILWGYTLKHCVGNGDFAKDMNKGKSVILSLQKEGEDKYTIQIFPGKAGVIDQAQGKSGIRPSPKLLESLDDLLFEAGVFSEDL